RVQSGSWGIWSVLGVSPDPEKVAAIRGSERPRTKEELRSVLGLCGYYREYDNNYAAKAIPLTTLTRRGVPDPIPWPQEAEDALIKLKDSLCNAVALYTPEPREPYWPFPDASATAAGACLAQVGEDGAEKPIAFASHRFTPTQTRWSTIEREAFAIIWALKEFDYWLFGARIHVVS
ncbi:polyprotein of retroviral origin, putative, partial [Ixodes scapularis]